MIQINAPQAIETNNINKCRNAYLYAASLLSRKLSRPFAPEQEAVQPVILRSATLRSASSGEVRY
jgi:hypothetical protein